MAKRKTRLNSDAHFDAYKVEQEYRKANPMPERPSDPRRVNKEDDAVPPKLIKHSDDGGVWVETYQNMHQDAPRLVINIAIGREVRVIEIAAHQQDLLWQELDRCRAEMEAMVSEMDAYREATTQHEEAMKLWREAANTHLEREREAFEAAQEQADE